MSSDTDLALPGSDELSLNGYHEELPPIEPYDLGALMRRNLPPPRVTSGLLYPHGVHVIGGPPESAKTILSLWLAHKAMLAGDTIAMIDEETGKRQIADLLRSMGAEPELIDDRFVYMPDLDLHWQDTDRGRLGELLRDRKPKLMILDSLAELLSASHVDENDSGAVTRWIKANMRPIARQFGCAVLLIDHDTKSERESRYTRGSGAKLSATEVTIKMRPVTPFSRSHDGKIEMTVSKDRFGCLWRYWRVDVQHSPLDLKFTKTTARETPDSSSDSSKISYAQKMMSVLADEAVPQQALVDRISAKFGHGLRRETAMRLLNELHVQGLAEKYDRPGHATLWGRPGAQLFDQPDTALPPSGRVPGGGWPEGTVGFDANA